MKHEIIELHDVQIIGMVRKIAFNEAKEECPKFWGEFVEKIIKPVVFEKKAPNVFQKAAFASLKAIFLAMPIICTSCNSIISCFIFLIIYHYTVCHPVGECIPNSWRRLESPYQFGCKISVLFVPK